MSRQSTSHQGCHHKTFLKAICTMKTSDVFYRVWSSLSSHELQPWLRNPMPLLNEWLSLQEAITKGFTILSKAILLPGQFFPPSVFLFSHLLPLFLSSCSLLYILLYENHTLRFVIIKHTLENCLMVLECIHKQCYTNAITCWLLLVDTPTSCVQVSWVISSSLGQGDSRVGDRQTDRLSRNHTMGQV